MKKIIATAALSILFVAVSFAQVPLAGSWMMKQSVMGTTIYDYLTFDNDAQGSANNKITIDFKFKMLGVKAEGKAEISLSGSFVADGDKLTINWDQESLNVTSTPIVMSFAGEVVDDGKEEFDGMLDEIVAEIKSDLEKHAVDEYFDVCVKRNKLSLTSLNDKGKKETDKFSRLE